MHALIDSNVLIDLFVDDNQWYEWSFETISDYAQQSKLYINQIIYAELCYNFRSLEELHTALPLNLIHFQNIPFEAAHLVSMAFKTYKQKGGTRLSALPDFYIGAHASYKNYTLITRDAKRYQTYFPELNLICPDK